MTVLTGIFAILPGVENIPPEGIQKWVNKRLGDHTIENYLANRVIYPQSVAVTNEEKLIDRAIIQEYIVRNPAFFYNPLTHKLLIPQDIVNRIQPTTDLMMIFCSLLTLNPITSVHISDGGNTKAEGTIIIPVPLPEVQKVNVSINGVNQILEKNKFYQLPTKDLHAKLKIENQNEIEVSGGNLGITIDLRIRSK